MLGSSLCFPSQDLKGVVGNLNYELSVQSSTIESNKKLLEQNNELQLKLNQKATMEAIELLKKTQQVRPPHHHHHQLS